MTQNCPTSPRSFVTHGGPTIQNWRSGPIFLTILPGKTARWPLLLDLMVKLIFRFVHFSLLHVLWRFDFFFPSSVPGRFRMLHRCCSFDTSTTLALLH